MNNFWIIGLPVKFNSNLIIFYHVYDVAYRTYYISTVEFQDCWLNLLSMNSEPKKGGDPLTIYMDRLDN